MFELDIEALFATETPRLTANAANLANAVPEDLHSLARVARLAISHQGVAANDDALASDPAKVPERWNWPNSPAMNHAEVDTFTVRLDRFIDQGLILPLAEALADRLVNRDRVGDDRRLCLECIHLQGLGRWRCANAAQADVAPAALAPALVLMLQRCAGFVSTEVNPMNRLGLDKVLAR